MEKQNNKSLNIYFYHTRLTRESYEEWKQFRFPGHILYGLPLLEKHNIHSVMHRYKHFPKRWQLTLYVTREILCCKEKYDILYGTSFRGLELIIFLHALGLYRKRIVVWHHQALRNSASKWRERISNFFYRGIDHMFFFSRKLIQDSIATRKTSEKKFELVHWGPDLKFYDHLLQELPADIQPNGFISTGKENRDILTLVRAFARTRSSLNVYISETCGNINYKTLLNGIDIPSNIQLHFTEGVIPYLLAQKVAGCRFIVICCLDFPYTVGLTTLVEALALGMPILCSRNPNFEIDIDKEKVGISIPYGDEEGWVNAINYLETHPEEAAEMGRNARKLAEERFNLEIFSKEIADSLFAQAEK